MTIFFVLQGRIEAALEAKNEHISPSNPTDFCMIIKLSLVSQILPIHTFLDRSSLKKSSHQNPDMFQAKSPSSLLFSHFFSTTFFSKLSCFQLSSQCAKIVQAKKCLRYSWQQQTKNHNTIFLEFEQQQKRKTSHKD